MPYKEGNILGGISNRQQSAINKAEYSCHLNDE